MNRYYDAFSCLEITKQNPDKLERALSSFEDIRDSIDSSLNAIGSMMYWAASGANNGDYQIPANESVNTMWKTGELMQLLIELKRFCEQNIVNIECSIKNGKTPKTAI